MQRGVGCTGRRRRWAARGRMAPGGGTAGELGAALAAFWGASAAVAHVLVRCRAGGRGGGSGGDLDGYVGEGCGGRAAATAAGRARGRSLPPALARPFGEGGGRT
jgi:hypothetical protein